MTSRSYAFLALALVSTSACQDAQKPIDPASPIATEAAAQPPDLGGGQKWIFRDPPRAFGSAVYVVEIRRDERCGDLARVQVVDLEKQSRYLQFWITFDALRRSIATYQGEASEGGRELTPGSAGNELPDLPCEKLDSTVAEHLQREHMLRWVE